MTSLFVVKTPLQLLNAIEAKARFKDDRNLLVLRYSREARNNEQMRALLGLTTWSDVIELGAVNGKGARYVPELFFLRKLRRSNRRFDRLFISEISNAFVDNIFADEIFLLDDGSRTLIVQEILGGKPAEGAGGRTGRGSRARAFVLPLLGLTNKSRKGRNLFTCFDLEPHADQVIVQHRYEYLSSLVAGSATVDQETVYFVGGNYIGLAELSAEYYREAVAAVRKHYGSRPFVYIPHRRESEQDLEGIKRIPGLRIERFERPMEIEFVMRRVSPKILASFLSTALYTMNLIHQLDRVDVFVLPDSQMSPSLKKAADVFYSYYGRYFALHNVR